MGGAVAPVSAALLTQYGECAYQLAHDVLQRVQIPFQVDWELQARRIAFACEVLMPVAENRKMSGVIAKRTVAAAPPVTGSGHEELAERLQPMA